MEEKTEEMLKEDEILIDNTDDGAEADDVSALAEEEADGKANKNSSPFGVIFFQTVIGLILAILYFTAAMIFPDAAAAYKTAVQKTSNEDFSFAFAIYELFQKEANESIAMGGGAVAQPANAILSPVLYNVDFDFPLKCSVNITSEYGYRTHPISGAENSFHTGVDLAAAKDTPIYAAGDAVVEKSEYDSSYGNYILLYHGNDLYTMYAHLNISYVKEGDKVSKGEIIGAVGTTGASTGYHLHFSAKKGDFFFNPVYLFPEELNAKL